MNKTKTTMRPTAPTGRNLTAEQYWRSMERSFNPDFIKAAKNEYERRKRLPLG